MVYFCVGLSHKIPVKYLVVGGFNKTKCKTVEGRNTFSRHHNCRVRILSFSAVTCNPVCLDGWMDGFASVLPSELHSIKKQHLSLAFLFRRRHNLPGKKQLSVQSLSQLAVLQEKCMKLHRTAVALIQMLLIVKMQPTKKSYHFLIPYSLTQEILVSL